MVGVIAPGVRAALRATRNGVVGVIGTEATIRTGGYQRAVGLGRRRSTAAACPVFVEHVERGDTTSPELRRAAAGYLAPLKREGVDTVILGCTHYPLLSGLLQLELGPDVVLVSSAEETAKDVYAELLRGDALRTGAEPAAPHVPRRPGTPARSSDLAERVPWAASSREVDAVHVETGRRRVRLTVLGPGHLAGRVPRMLRLPAQRRGVHTCGSTPAPARSRGSRSTCPSATSAAW